MASPMRIFVAALDRRRAWASVLQTTKLAPESRVDHAIDGVAATAADTDDPDRARLGRARMANPAGDGDQEAEG